jgi:drug/metabolite transporter (DMT)-like permease
VSRKLKADLLLVSCTLIWGATFVLVKDALADSSVFVFLALRFLLATAVLLLMYGRELRAAGVSGLRAGAIIGCCMFGGYAFQTAGLALTTPSKAAFITGFFVVLVPVLLALFGSRRVPLWVWLGALSAFAGLYFLAVPSSGLAALNRGDVLVFGCAVMFALHVISIGHYSLRYSAGALTLIQVAVTSLFTALCVPLFAVIGAERPRVAWTPGLIAAVLATGIFATALAFSVQVWAQQYTSANHAAIIFTLEPVFAGLTSYIFYHERLGARSMAGAVLILGGILIAELLGPAPAAEASVPPSETMTVDPGAELTEAQRARRGG